jgi:tetratricopeptide (TPR) repeat protein
VGINFTSRLAAVPTPTASTGTAAGTGSGAEQDRLDSWKEIACYLKREVRTVQLWEKNEGLPIHRHFHRSLGSVFAFRSEIEKWKQEVSHARSVSETAFNALKFGRRPIRIHVLPLAQGTFCRELRNWCNAILANTLEALRQIDPERLAASLFDRSDSQSQTELNNSPLTCNPEEYLLRWNMEDKGTETLITVYLESFPERKEIWSLTHQCDRHNWKEAPRQFSEQIAQCVWLKLTALPRPMPRSGSEAKRRSQEAYLKGRYLWKQRRHDSLRKAIQCFESAIRHDPKSALPYSGLADSLTLLSFYEIVPPPEVMPAARCAALKAIELDPNLAEAHVSLADVLLHFDRDWQGADREYRRAIQCNPEYALGYHWYSNLLAAKGQHQAAQLAVMNALELDPVSVITLVWAGVTCYLARQFDDAILRYKDALELEPNFVWAHMYMAQALEQKGEFGEAWREFETAIRLADGNNCVKAMKAHSYALSGDKSSARGILHELRGKAVSKCVPSYDIAATYAALADPDRMISWLDRACQERNMKLFTLPQDPRFDPYRNRSEFREVVARIGLGPA